MPNIREQKLDENGLYILTSDGQEFEATPAELRSIFGQARTDGGRGQKLLARLSELMGDEQLAALKLSTDDGGNVTGLEVS